MKNSKSNAKADSLAVFLLKGAIIGLVATQALDLVSTALYDGESENEREGENATRGGKQAYEVAVSRFARALGKNLTREEEKVWGWRFHKTFGVMGGIQYLALRNKFPKVGSALGLPFGLGFFLVADEIMLSAFKLTPGPTAFTPWVHARGAIAHTAYGVAAETTTRALEALPGLLVKEDAYLMPKAEKPHELYVH